MDKCFCHLNGYAVKDATARGEIADIKETYATKEYVDNATPNIDLEPYATKEELTDYATKEYVNNLGTVLFNDAAGVSGDITLSDSVANYTYIEVYFNDNGGYDHGAEKFYNINNKTFCLEVSKVWENSSSKVQFEMKSVTCKAIDNAITITNYGYIQTSETSISQAKKSNYILITRVVGYK